MNVVRGKVQEVVLKHDASRIVQTIVKYGGQTERNEIAAELKGHYRALAQSKYSKVRDYASAKISISSNGCYTSSSSRNSSAIAPHIAPPFYSNLSPMSSGSSFIEKHAASSQTLMIFTRMRTRGHYYCRTSTARRSRCFHLRPPKVLQPQKQKRLRCGRVWLERLKVQTQSEENEFYLR